MRLISVFSSIVFALLLTIGLIHGIAIANYTEVNSSTPAYSTIIFVNANTAGLIHDGISWSTAYTSVQDALTTAISGTQIWVAEGIYYPDEGIGQVDNRITSTFLLTDNVALYGGFDGSESLLIERDWIVHPTILSGDIDKNDINIDENFISEDWEDIVGDNSYHVIYSSGLAETAILDGFIITAGDAHGSLPNDRGGGMLNMFSNPFLSNLIFTGNMANFRGGAIFNWSSSPIQLNSKLSGNYAGNCGGGIFNYKNSESKMTKVTISDNWASFGGGMSNYQSNPILFDVIFTGNSAGEDGTSNDEGYGGGIHNDDSNPSLTGVVFTGNWASWFGGGIYNSLSHPILTDVQFNYNSAHNNLGGSGGGMFNDYSNPTLIAVNFINNWSRGAGGMNNFYSNPTLKSVKFINNSAVGGDTLGGWGGDGGGMSNFQSIPNLWDVSFSQNTAGYGGGMYNSESSPTLDKVDFSGNVAVGGVNWDGKGGGIYNKRGSSPRLHNVIFSGNSADYGGGLFNRSDGTPSLTNVTIASNSADYGGGLFNEYDCNPRLSNTILWGNTATFSGTQIYNDDDSSPVISYTLVQDSGGSENWEIGLGTDNGGNIDANPHFERDPDLENNLFGDLHLLFGSPAINSGTNYNCPDTDFDGFPRPMNGICDMGAFEYPNTYFLPLVVR